MEKLGFGTSETGIRIEIPEEPSQRFLKRTGVVLQRGNYLEGNTTVLLFLKGSGTVRVNVPGASKGSVRFGGALEPFVWGHYQLYQSKRRTYIREIEVAEDFWKLRTKPRAVITAVRLARLLSRYLIPGYPYDSLLALFYWAEKALEADAPPEAVSGRFLWKWLSDWGAAPDLIRCSSCGNSLDGRAYWEENSFVCSKCASTDEAYEIGEFVPYALSSSFMPAAPSEALLVQADAIRKLLVRNLELYR